MAAPAVLNVIAKGKKVYDAYKMIKTASGVVKAVKNKDYRGAAEGIGGLMGGSSDSTSGVLPIFSSGGIMPRDPRAPTHPWEKPGGGIFDKLGDTFEDWKDKISDFSWNVDGKEILRDTFRIGAAGLDLKRYYDQYKRIKQIEGLTYPGDNVEQFEQIRDEQMQILGTDPSALADTFSAGTLRKHGIDPDSLDAQSMMERRGFRRQLAQQGDEMARAFGRSGFMGNSAMAAASAQLGLQGSMYDAQLGMAANKAFTEQMANLQERYAANTENMIKYEQAQANWEMAKQKEIYDMEQKFLEDMAKAARKARLGLGEKKPSGAENAKTVTPGTDEDIFEKFENLNTTVDEDGNIIFGTRDKNKEPIVVSDNPDHFTLDELMNEFRRTEMRKLGFPEDTIDENTTPLYPHLEKKDNLIIENQIVKTAADEDWDAAQAEKDARSESTQDKADLFHSWFEKFRTSGGGA
tara:strand:+ start:8334 stop:9725 length:1392 start_codon:yes stop_codon:yes gene_type:complete